jgi:hypothetical protein
VKFVVYAPALNGDDSVLSLIDRLVDRFAEEVHLVEIPDADLLQDSIWYQKARATRRKLLTSAIGKPLRAGHDGLGPHAKAVEVLDAESARLAERLAHSPLVILVEDREADGVLLDIIVNELGWPELQKLWRNGKTVTPRAAAIETAGGIGAIPQRVERAVSDAAEEMRPQRLFVLCDSDARWPGDQNESLARRISAVRKVCAKFNVPYHVLRKRCAENYIPDQVFEAIREDLRNSSDVDRFNALLRRSKEQRDHFPVKDGLSPEERVEAIQAGLYHISEEKDLKLLEDRLFQRRPRALLRLNSERRESFTAVGLRERDGEGELDLLLRKIAREL